MTSPELPVYWVTTAVLKYVICRQNILFSYLFFCASKIKIYFSVLCLYVGYMYVVKGALFPTVPKFRKINFQTYYFLEIASCNKEKYVGT